MSDIEVLSYSFSVVEPHDGEKYELQRSADGSTGWETIAYTNDNSLTDSGLDIHTE